MKCFIEKEFEYSDGIDVQNKIAYEGTTVDIPDDYVAGLANEGYVSDPYLKGDAPDEPLENKDAGASSENAADLVGAQTAMDIPEGWEALSAKNTHVLATSLTGIEYPNKPAASEAIKAVIADRDAQAGAV
jgi:hypothetical protein